MFAQLTKLETLMEADFVTSTQASRYSSFIVYVDESGDHGMLTLDANYPVFVLAFCVFHKRHYAEKVVPSLETFKFHQFGHDLVVLHETDIRKEKGSFTFFKSRQHKENFIAALTDTIKGSHFILIASVIHKAQLQGKAGLPPNPYHLALGFCLETLYEFLEEKGQQQLTTHVMVECRGKKEDRDLQLEFRRICGGANRLGKHLPAPESEKPR